MAKEVPQQAIIVASYAERKEYSYEKNGTTLSFKLLSSTPKEMEEFRDMMKLAIIDIEKDLKKFIGKKRS